MAAARGTAARGIEWARRNRGTGPNRVKKWTKESGLSGFQQWCGIFLGSLLRAQGLTPPKGYPLAIAWKNYGTKVASLAQAQPGDIIVYANHVQMYLGRGRAIQGNDVDGTVGESGVGSGLGLGPILAIRRPPWKGGADGLTAFERSLVAQGKSPKEARAIAAAEGIKPEPILGEKAFEPVEKAGEAAIEGATTGVDLAKAVVGTLENPESFLLTTGLLGGGAFLIYYGVAQLFGVRRPVAGPAGAATKAASIA